MEREGEWWGLLSSRNYRWQVRYLHVPWGGPGDTPIPGDYDGDAQTDLAVHRPEMGEWWALLWRHTYDWHAVYLHVSWSAAGD